MMPMSKAVSGFVRHLTWGKWAKVEMPEKPQSVPHLFSNSSNCASEKGRDSSIAECECEPWAEAHGRTLAVKAATTAKDFIVNWKSQRNEKNEKNRRGECESRTRVYSCSL